MIGTLGGYKVVTLDYLFEKPSNIPKRKSKKKRIQKKLIKKYGYSKKIDYKFILCGDVIYCHSKMLDKIT